MPARRNNRRYLLWLALGTTFMAAAMAVLLALGVTLAVGLGLRQWSEGAAQIWLL